MDLVLFSLFLISLIVIGIRNIFAVQEGQRLAVLRFGKLEKVAGPGLTFTIPFLDQGIVVTLEDHLPNRQNLNEKQIIHEVAKVVKTTSGSKPLGSTSSTDKPIVEKITIDGPVFYSYEDESIFFQCVYGLPGFSEVKGCGKQLTILFSEKISDQTKAQLNALCRRWNTQENSQL